MNFNDLKIITLIALACHTPTKQHSKLVYTSLLSLVLRSQRLQTLGKQDRILVTGLLFS